MFLLLLRTLHAERYVLYDKITYELLFIVVFQLFLQKQQKIRMFVQHLYLFYAERAFRMTHFESLINITRKPHTISTFCERKFNRS